MKRSRYRRVQDPMPPQESGLLGAMRRWGPRRVLRLDDFDPEERAAIAAIIDARRAAKARQEQRARDDAA